MMNMEMKYKLQNILILMKRDQKFNVKERLIIELKKFRCKKHLKMKMEKL